MAVILTALAVFCFLLVAFGVSHPKVNLLALGLALWASIGLLGVWR